MTLYALLPLSFSLGLALFLYCVYHTDIAIDRYRGFPSRNNLIFLYIWGLFTLFVGLLTWVIIPSAYIYEFNRVIVPQANLGIL